MSKSRRPGTDLEEFATLINGWFWETDRDNRFIYLSESVEEITGIRPEWHYGKSRTEMFGDDINITEFRQHIKTIAAHKPFSEFKYKRIGPNGENWISVSGKPNFDANGNFVGYHGIGRDISNEVALAEEAKGSKSRLVNALEIIDEGFVFYDKDDRLILCNEKYKDYYPKSRDLIVPGARFEDIIRQGAQRGEYEAAIGRIEEWVSERMAIHKIGDTLIEQKLTDGRWLRIAERKTPDGGIVGFRIDITELKKSKNSAEAASEAKTAFLAAMSHELRTPMNAILGFGQMLDYNPKEPLSKTQKDIVANILKGGQHLLDLINDILDLAQIEAGKVELSLENISPKTVIDDCLSLISAMAKKHDIGISVPNATTDLPKVHADYTRFKQVLLNLMSNAVKYNRANGTVFVDFGVTADDMFRIAVTDTGEGIHKDKQSQLFKPFSRLGAENSGIEGSGIGLVVCKDLVELMDGTIGMESEVGKGSSFWIELPLAKSDRHQTAEESVPDATQMEQSLPRMDGTLLYIEDNPDNLKLMEMIVSRIAGLSLISARTGELGVELARAERPDVIIVDINLPGIDGMEALNQLRRFENTRNIPVMALSAAATRADIEKGMKAGFRQYLTKPVQVFDIVDAIKAALE